MDFHKLWLVSKHKYSQPDRVTTCSSDNSIKYELIFYPLLHYSTRSHFAELCLSVHNLHITTGIYAKTLRFERYCVFFKSSQQHFFDDEVYFLLICPLY